jgi:hypothetical protein
MKRQVFQQQPHLKLRQLIAHLSQASQVSFHKRVVQLQVVFITIQIKTRLNFCTLKTSPKSKSAQTMFLFNIKKAIILKIQNFFSK